MREYSLKIWHFTFIHSFAIKSLKEAPMKYLESLQVPVPDSNSRRRRWQEIEASFGESDSDDLLQLMLTPVLCHF